MSKCSRCGLKISGTSWMLTSTHENREEVFAYAHEKGYRWVCYRCMSDLEEELEERKREERKEDEANIREAFPFGLDMPPYDE